MTGFEVQVQVFSTINARVALAVQCDMPKRVLSSRQEKRMQDSIDARKECGKEGRMV